MTTPQPEQETPQQRRAAVALAALLAAGLTAQQVLQRARPLLAPLGLTGPAVAAAVRLAMSSPPARVSREVQVRAVVRTTLPGRQPTAAPEQLSAETAWRARYLLAAAERMSEATTAAELQQATAAEARYLQQHRAAQARRIEAAVVVDRARIQHGRVLGWYAKKDDRVTPECRMLDGANFTADRKPAPGWPGQLHGGTCRCTAGAAHVTARTVDQVWAARGRQEEAA